MSIANEALILVPPLAEAQQGPAHELPVVEDAPGPGSDGDEREGVVADQQDFPDGWQDLDNFKTSLRYKKETLRQEGWLHSMEVAYLLLTQQPRVRFQAFPQKISEEKLSMLINGGG